MKPGSKATTQGRKKEKKKIVGVVSISLPWKVWGEREERDEERVLKEGGESRKGKEGGRPTRCSLRPGNRTAARKGTEADHFDCGHGGRRLLEKREAPPRSNP